MGVTRGWAQSADCGLFRSWSVVVVVVLVVVVVAF